MKNKNFKYPNTGNAFILGFATYYVISIVYEIIMIAKFPDGEPNVAKWCSYLLSPIAFIGIMLAYAKSKNVDVVSATKIKGKLSFKQVGLIFLLSIFCIMTFLPISNIFLDILGRMGFSMSLGIVDTSASVGAYFLGLLLLAVFPAISEEFFMRGVVLNCAEQKRDYSYAILITAAMFSLMHGNPIQTVHQFLLGIILAYIVLVSRSLWAGILLHFFNNFWSLTLDYPVSWIFEKTGMNNMNVGLWYLLWIVLILVGGTMLVYTLKKFTKFSVKSAPVVSNETQSVASEPEIIDVYEGRDGVFTTKKTPDVAIKEKQNDFKACFTDFISIFKKGGLKNLYKKINTIISGVVGESADEELTKEDIKPANIKLTFIILAVIWIVSLVSGFLN